MSDRAANSVLQVFHGRHLALEIIAIDSM